jgi:hypothetical protein
MNYSLGTPVIVIVIVALVEELPALLVVLITALLGVAVSAIEMLVSLSPNKTDSINMIVRMTRKTGFFTSTPS